MNGRIRVYGRSGLPTEWEALGQVVTSTVVTFVGIVAECVVAPCLIVISANVEAFLRYI